jgi:hypothetical protein
MGTVCQVVLALGVSQEFLPVLGRASCQGKCAGCSLVKIAEGGRNICCTICDRCMEFLVKAAIPVAVVVVLALARKYMAVSVARPSERSHSRAELDARFISDQWIVGLQMAVVGVVFAWVTHEALLWTNRYLSKGDGGVEFHLWPQSAIWWFFPGFGALCLCWEITLRLWALFGHKEAARLYNYWSNLKNGFDGVKLLRWMAILVLLPSGILTILALPMRCSLREIDLRDCGYAFAGCKVYRYSDARRMTIIEGWRNRDGKLTRRAGIVIDFNDGRRWSSADIGDFLARPDPALVEFLKKKTGLPYEHAETEDDIPPLS